MNKRKSKKNPARSKGTRPKKMAKVTANYDSEIFRKAWKAAGLQPFAPVC